MTTKEEMNMIYEKQNEYLEKLKDENEQMAKVILGNYRKDCLSMDFWTQAAAYLNLPEACRVKSIEAMCKDPEAIAFIYALFQLDPSYYYGTTLERFISKPFIDRLKVLDIPEANLDLFIEARWRHRNTNNLLLDAYALKRWARGLKKKWMGDE